MRSKFDLLAWFMLAVSCVVLVFSLAFNFFGFEKKLSIQGPFQQEAPLENSKSFVINLKQALFVKNFLTTGGDTIDAPKRSNLHLKINGQTQTLSHSPHKTIREKGEGAFSHWDNYLIFSLPIGLQNNDNIRIDVSFTKRIDHFFINSMAFFVFILISIIIYRFRLRSRLLFLEFLRIFFNGFVKTMYGSSIIFLLLCFLFLISTFLGAWNGFILPNTALFRWLPQLNFLSLCEPKFGQIVLFFAMVGLILSWGASRYTHSRKLYLSFEVRMANGFNRYGVICLIALFLYSVGATWAGIPRTADLSGTAIAGLVPFSDANGHFQYAYQQALHGEWESFVARRPLAASFRSILVAAVDYNNYYFLMLQVVALACATFFAARSIVAWRGIWAGLTFAGLVFIVVRPYLPTNLTEPLGIFWALVSVPFLVRTIRFKNLGQGIAGLHLVIWALMIRMGAMFTVPAIGLWLILSRMDNRSKVLKASFWVILIFIANISLSSGLFKIYATADGAVGSNFSHVVCGLAHGKIWSGCGEIYAEEIKNIPYFVESVQAKFYYTKAFEKFSKEPSIFFYRLLEGELYFINHIQGKMLSGYNGTVSEIFPSTIWWLCVFLGLVWVLKYRQEAHERMFWFLIVLGLLASAPFIIFDDGWRVMSASLILVCVLLACGLTSPIHEASSEENSSSIAIQKYHYALLAATAALCLFVPKLAYQHKWLEQQNFKQIVLEDDEEIFLGTRRMTGFLVIPDGEVLPKHVPAIHEANFIKIVRNSDIEEYYEPLVTPIPIHKPPFAIVAAVPVNKRTNGYHVLPAHVFSKLDNQAWKVRMEKSPGKFWIKVIEVTPINQ